jgi:uncharacterized damage-inducible protein DinB
MLPMTTYRRWHFEQLSCSLDLVQHIIENSTDEILVTRREKPEGWTAAEVVGHLLDCERLFLERARLIQTQDLPDLPFPPQDDEVRAGKYNERSPQSILDEWRKTREEFLKYVGAIESEEAWAREGKHPTGKFGPFSQIDMLFLEAWHDMRHIRQITRILKMVE